MSGCGDGMIFLHFDTVECRLECREVCGGRRGYPELF